MKFASTAATSALLYDLKLLPLNFSDLYYYVSVSMYALKVRFCPIQYIGGTMNSEACFLTYDTSFIFVLAFIKIFISCQKTFQSSSLNYRLGEFLEARLTLTFCANAVSDLTCSFLIFVVYQAL